MRFNCKNCKHIWILNIGVAEFDKMPKCPKCKCPKCKTVEVIMNE